MLFLLLIDGFMEVYCLELQCEYSLVEQPFLWT